MFDPGAMGTLLIGLDAIQDDTAAKRCVARLPLHAERAPSGGAGERPPPRGRSAPAADGRRASRGDVGPEASSSSARLPTPVDGADAL